MGYEHYTIIRIDTPGVEGVIGSLLKQHGKGSSMPLGDFEDALSREKGGRSFFPRIMKETSTLTHVREGEERSAYFKIHTPWHVGLWGEMTIELTPYYLRN